MSTVQFCSECDFRVEYTGRDVFSREKRSTSVKCKDCHKNLRHVCPLCKATPTGVNYNTHVKDCCNKLGMTSFNFCRSRLGIEFCQEPTENDKKIAQVLAQGIPVEEFITISSQETQKVSQKPKKSAKKPSDTTTTTTTTTTTKNNKRGIKRQREEEEEDEDESENESNEDACDSDDCKTEDEYQFKKFIQMVRAKRMQKLQQEETSKNQKTKPASKKPRLSHHVSSKEEAPVVQENNSQSHEQLGCMVPLSAFGVVPETTPATTTTTINTAVYDIDLDDLPTFDFSEFDADLAAQQANEMERFLDSFQQGHFDDIQRELVQS